MLIEESMSSRQNKRWGDVQRNISRRHNFILTSPHLSSWSHAQGRGMAAGYQSTTPALLYKTPNYIVARCATADPTSATAGDQDKPSWLLWVSKTNRQLLP